MLAYLCMAAAVLCYGASTLLLAQGSAGTADGRAGSVLRNRAYLAGIGCQGAAFLLSYVARIFLPLVLVQSAVAASVAVTAAAGAALGRWRLQAFDVAALAAVVVGVALAGATAEPGRAAPGGLGVLALTAVVTGGLLLATRARGLAAHPAGAAGLGALSGVAFAGSAIGARALGDDLFALLRDPAAVLAAGLVVGGTLVGQVLLTAAFRGGSVTGPVAALYVVSTVVGGLIGYLALGDRVRPGLGAAAVLGVVLALAGTVRLARHEPADHTP